MKRIDLRKGISADALLLAMIKMVTAVLGFAITRLLSEYLTISDYGTYSQILLIVSAVSSLTIFGMMDSVNFFYSTARNETERENSVATMFTMQCVISTVAGGIVLALSTPLCSYFDNPKIRSLLLFAAVLPMLQNLINMMQVLLISVGKARMLAVRNFIVSAVRLLVVLLVVTAVRDVAVILWTSLLLDIAQIAAFYIVLRKAGFAVRLRKIEKEYAGRIVHYCAPMATFIILNNLNRDVDKYLIAAWTDTETLAMYSNASKLLPFEIVISSFSAVLLPRITKAIVAQENTRAAALYRAFLEISYISTSIMCCAALAASPQLMELLYTRKYLSGLPVFQIYILVDMFRFTNITMILAAAGKTGKLMFLSLGALAGNAVLNFVLFKLMGVSGPAVATLLVTLGLGLLILNFGAKELKTRLRELFDCKFLLWFAGGNLVLTVLLYGAQTWLAGLGLHYLAVLAVICGAYGLVTLALYGKRLLRALKNVNKIAKQQDNFANNTKQCQ